MFTQPPVAGWLGECTPAKRLIRLKRGLSGEGLRQTLLHEMCHADGPMGHGQRFQAQLARLVRQGEAWAREELQYYRDGHHTWPARQRQLKATLQDLASAQPRPSLVAIRRVAADTLACRPSDVPRKVPWLEASWHQACAQADQARAPSAPSTDPGVLGHHDHREPPAPPDLYTPPDQPRPGGPVPMR